MTSDQEIIESLAKVISGFQVHTITRLDKIEFGEDIRDEAEAFLQDGGSLDEAIERFGGDLLETSIEEHNVFLNEGINDIFNKIVGTVGTAFNNANAECGVGNSTTSESATQTGLIGGSQLYKAQDGSYPLGAGSGQNVDFRSTFGSSEANFAWEEFCTRNGVAPGIDLHRTVSAQGTKISGQTWVLTITLSAT
ncbi:MAG: hypothetical protein V3W37_08035 [Candidatus Binatia bacterium]